MSKTHFKRNYLPKMAQSLYITEIYRLWQSNCVKLKRDFSQRFSQILSQNLSRCNDFRIPSIRTLHHASESISLLGPKIWNIIPNEVKQQTSPNRFKKLIKVDRVVEIFKIWYFVISDRKTIIYLKHWRANVEKIFLSTTLFTGNTFFLLFTIKIFFEKLYCRK